MTTASFKMLKLPTALLWSLTSWECVSNAVNVKESSADKKRVLSVGSQDDLKKKKNLDLFQHIDSTAKRKYCTRLTN